MRCEEEPTYHYKRSIIGPAVKHHCVSQQARPIIGPAVKHHCVSQQARSIIGPAVKHHCVSWQANNGPTLNAGLVALQFFRGSAPVLLRNPCPLSVSAHVVPPNKYMPNIQTIGIFKPFTQDAAHVALYQSSLFAT